MEYCAIHRAIEKEVSVRRFASASFPVLGVTVLCAVFGAAQVSAPAAKAAQSPALHGLFALD
jgi:hypothetical protein